MTAPARELFANNAASTLDGSIDGSQTSFDVIDGSVFPSTGNFRLIVESELMLCTARSSDSLTVIRGIEGSTPDSHASAAPIAQIVTVGGLAAALKDNDALAGSDRPALGRIVADDGITPLTASDFTALNSGSLTDSGGGIVLRNPPQASGENARGGYRTAPSAPWTRVMAMQISQVGNNGSVNNHDMFGMILRESGTGKLILFAVGKLVGPAVPQIFIGKLTSATNYNSDLLGETSFYIHNDVIWLKVEDDTTDLTFSISSDGSEWIEVFTGSRTAFLAGGPDQVGFASRRANACTRDSLLRLCAWFTE